MSAFKITKLRQAMAIGLAIVAIAATACMGNYFATVHYRFNTSGTNNELTDFGKAPQEVMVNSWNNLPRRGYNATNGVVPSYLDIDSFPTRVADEDGNGSLPWKLKPTIEQVDKLPGEYADSHEAIDPLRKYIHAGRHLEVQGKFRQAIDAYRKAEAYSAMKGFVQDREELIQEGLNSSSQGYAEYLRSRYLLEFGYDSQKEQAKQTLEKLEALPKLKPHVQYVLATLLESEDDPKAKAFLKIAKDFPTSPRAESAITMAARTYLENSDADSRPWDKGIAAFQLLLEKYPKSRFRWSAYGWLASYKLSQKNTNGAVSYYLKQSRSPIPWESWKGHQGLSEIAKSENRLADAAVHWLYQRSLPVSLPAKYAAARQMRHAFESFTPKDVSTIQATIKRDSGLLSSYVNFRLEDTAMTPKQERQLLEFIDRCVEVAGKIDRKTYARIAQIQYNSGRYSRALQAARRGTGASGQEGDLAKYIEAASLVRMGNPTQGLAKYSRLHKATKFDFIRFTCAENIALLNEKYGDPVKSYEYYRSIGYSTDMQFLADSYLSPAQLKRLITKSLSKVEKDALTYTLAMRYFRKEQYEPAIAILSKIPKQMRMNKGIDLRDYQKREGDYYAAKDSSYESFDLESVTDTKDSLDDVKALQKLRHRADHDSTSKKRAEALYEMAQYNYRRRTLMYYSGALWKSGRAGSWMVWNDAINRGLADKRAMESANEHECDAQTIRLCDELVAKYPRSEFAPKALYTAAVAGEKLSRFNSWWRGQEKPLLKGAIRRLNRLVRDYPKNALVKDAKKYANEFSEGLKVEY